MHLCKLDKLDGSPTGCKALHSLPSLSLETSVELMEKKGAMKDEGLLQYPFLFLLVLVVGLIFTDPFHLGPLGGHSYRPVKHDIAPYKVVMNQWPRDNQSRLRTGKLEFVGEVYGPESLEFDLEGRGPYTGLADGRVVRWLGNDVGWETFALVSPTWSDRPCSNGVKSTTSKQSTHEQLCGRPLGLRFDQQTGYLYIADAYYGLLVVSPRGGLATPLATHAEGKPILFANDLDIHRNGSIFFTDSSMRYNRLLLSAKDFMSEMIADSDFVLCCIHGIWRMEPCYRNHFFVLLEGEATGRLLRYDPSSSTTHVVLHGLAFPNGVQISKDQTFLLFTETTNCRIMRYWLEGPRMGAVEIFANLPGFPDNIRLNEKGQFWVAIDCCRTPIQEIMSHNPWIRNIYFRLPLKMKYLARMIGMKMYTVISLFDEKGEILDVLEDQRGEVMKLISEVKEVDGKLWIGTVKHNQIATFPFP
ncbi:Protein STRICTOSIDINE SYNTHASE-LIKE 13 [Asimina triloba]